MLFNQILKLELNKEDITQAIEISKKNLFIDNLRDRHPNVAFDCKLRGYIGEIAIKKWFLEFGITMTETNYFMDDINMDIDFMHKNINIELKTSLIPDVDKTLENVFNRRDIKIIKREENIKDIKGDVHIQIYYDHNTKLKDNWLKSLDVNLNSSPEVLYEKFLAKSYLNKTYLFCWIDKFTLIKRLELLAPQNQCWQHSKREFWVCPLRNSLPPMELISFLKRF